MSIRSSGQDVLVTRIVISGIMRYNVSLAINCIFIIDSYLIKTHQ